MEGVFLRLGCVILKLTDNRNTFRVIFSHHIPEERCILLYVFVKLYENKKQTVYLNSNRTFNLLFLIYFFVLIEKKYKPQLEQSRKYQEVYIVKCNNLVLLII